MSVKKVETAGGRTRSQASSDAPTSAELTFTCVTLEWRERPVHVAEDGTVSNEAILFDGLRGELVYAFEGRHDAHPFPGVLYIGRTGKGGKRPQKSFNRFRNPNGLAVWADCSNLVLRWAHVQPKHLSDVERILIWANCPPFNAQEVRTTFRGPKEMIVFNTRAKGRLLPISAGIFHHADVEWPLK